MNRRTKLLAAVTRAVAVALTVSAAGPAAAQEVREPVSTAPSPLRESISRAIENAAAMPQDAATPVALSNDERADVASRAGRLQADPVAGQASGGGTVKTIVTVLGIAASVWATWYTIQWMKKQQEKAGFRP
jgi:hypothetical protein